MDSTKLILLVSASVYLGIGFLMWAIGRFEGMFLTKPLKTFLFVLVLWPWYDFSNSNSKK